jgi:hypothetical protein
LEAKLDGCAPISNATADAGRGYTLRSSTLQRSPRGEANALAGGRKNRQLCVDYFIEEAI